MKTAGICLLFLYMNTYGKQMFLIRGRKKGLLVRKNKTVLPKMCKISSFGLTIPRIPTILFHI